MTVRIKKCDEGSEYAKALQRGEGNLRNCDDADLMAHVCEFDLPYLVGAVSGRMVWEGAMKRGLTSLELFALAYEDIMKVSDLQWEE